MGIDLQDLTNSGVDMSLPLRGDSWVIPSSVESPLLQQTASQGESLSMWDVTITLGVTTGINDVFVINDRKKRDLVSSHLSSEAVLRPLLRGRDIKRWDMSYNNLWMLTMYPAMHLKLNDFPAVEGYLLDHRSRMTPKPHGYKGEWGGRRESPHMWFETQDPIPYYKLFNDDKIIYPIIAKDSSFLHEDKGFTVLASAFFITGRHLKYLVGLLNSKLAWVLMRERLPRLRGGYFSFNKHSMKTLPLKRWEKENKMCHKIVDTVDSIKKKALRGESVTDEEDTLNKAVYCLYNLSASDIRIIENTY